MFDQRAGIGYSSTCPRFSLPDASWRTMHDTSEALDAILNLVRNHGGAAASRRIYQGVTMSHTARSLFIAASIAAAMLLFHAEAAVAQDKSTPAAGKQAPADEVRPISDEDIEMLRKDIRSQRKQLIAANMKLTDVEAEKFFVTPTGDRGTPS